MLKACTLDNWKILTVDFGNDNLGATDIWNKNIEYSKKWLQEFLDTKNYIEIKRLVLHEVAHALTAKQNIYLARGHGKLWQNYCKLLGIKGEKAKYYYE